MSLIIVVMEVGGVRQREREDGWTKTEREMEGDTEAGRKEGR